MKRLFYLGATCLISLQAYALQDPSLATPSYVETALDKPLQDIKEIAKEAGKKILEIRSSSELNAEDVILKNGKTIRQTNADVEAGEYSLAELTQKYPTYGVLSKDHMDQDESWYLKEFVWMINPIDGTKAFEQGTDDFHIQIGLLEGNESLLGLSYYPATDTYVWAVKGQGAWLEQGGMKQQLLVEPCKEHILIKSKSSYTLIESYFTKWDWTPDQILDEELSSTTRLLKLIQGQASLYISLGASPLSEEKKGGVWNYGANLLIAQESGLTLKTLKGNPINLREPSALLTEGVVLSAEAALCEKIAHSDWRF